jgi:hypothetical protein
MSDNVLPFNPARKTFTSDGTELFKRLSDLGYIVIPIVPYDREFITEGKVKKVKPGGKAPGRYDPSTGQWHGLSGWQRFIDEPPGARTIAKWASYTTNGLPGVGVLTGHKVCAVDIDVMHPDLAMATLNLAHRILGLSKFIRIGKNPKSLLVYQVIGDEPLMKMKSAGFDLEGYTNLAVEVLGRGQQFVAFGVHPETKQPYSWPVKSILESPVDDLPPVTPAQLREFIREFEFLAEVYGATPKNQSSIDEEPRVSSELADSRGHIASAVASLPAELADDYHTWVRVGLAIKAALPDDPGLALELWDEFSAKSEKYDPESINDKFSSFHAERIGAGTLYRLAKEAGWVAPEGITTSAEDDFAAIDPIELPADAPQKSPLARPALYYKKPSDITPELNRVALVEELLETGAMSVLYGDSNVGKSFVAFDLAFHIATGRDWDHKKVLQGAVIYVAAEGGKSAENRIAALKTAYNLGDFPLFLVPCAIDLLNNDADTRPLIKLIQHAATTEGLPVRLVVIDTLSRAMAGGNENDSKDMGAFVRHIDVIRSAIDAHIMIVHHSGKDKARGARGHSLLRAATDTEIEVAEKRITATKQRDMEFGKAIGFQLKVIELGMNPYGKPITSCIVEKRDATHLSEFTDTHILDPRDALVLNAFYDILASLPHKRKDAIIETKIWAQFCKRFDMNRSPGCPPWPDDEKSFNKAFKRSRERLSQLGYITEAPGSTRGNLWVSALGDAKETLGGQ